LTTRNICPFCRYDIDTTGHQKQCQHASKLDIEAALARAERKKQLDADNLKKFGKTK